MGTAKLLILENQLGQKVRTFSVEAEALNIVYLKDKRRVEAFSRLDSLDENKIDYRLLKTFNISQLDNGSVIVEGVGRLRWAPLQVVNSPRYELPETTDDEDLKLLLQKTTLVHLVAVFVLMLGAWAWARYFS
ncbi:MAG TPA: hypothetical protein VN132_15995, partial [Bdellovibrio sp.]|nr:hypothetical protein [Bdellovibrio sp.]